MITPTVRDSPRWVPRKGVRSLVHCFFPCETIHHHESALVSSSLRGTSFKTFLPNHTIETKTSRKPRCMNLRSLWQSWYRRQLHSELLLFKVHLRWYSAKGFPHTGCQKGGPQTVNLWHSHILNTPPQAPVAHHAYLAVSKSPQTKLLIQSCLESQRTISWRGTEMPSSQWQNTLASGGSDSAGEHCKRALAGPH